MEVRYPPPQKGYLSDTCAIPYKNKANGCDTPLCDTISRGYCAIWGGIPHWAAKGAKERTRKSAKERKRAKRVQKSAMESVCVKIANNQVWELPTRAQST